MPIPDVMPSNTRVKRGLAHAFSYGVVPADFVAEYDGGHAEIRVDPGRPTICICGPFPLAGSPVIVKLHENVKKDIRELDAGRMPVIGTKTGEARESDLIAVDVSQPERGVWLVRPRQDLPAGEYALMLGTRNVNIFPFTLAAAPERPAMSSSAKR